MGACEEFFFDDDSDSPTLTNRLTLSDEQYTKIQTIKDQVQAHLERHLGQRSNRPIRFWIQGSYKNGTILRPVRKGQEFDVDLGAYIEWPVAQAGFRPKQIKTWTREALAAFAAARPGASVETPPKPRCERINIDREFHLDVPTYHLDPQIDLRRLANEDNTWESSDPKALQVWFLNATANRDRDAVKRVIKYLKAWAALKWSSPDGRPNSTALTILATRFYPNDYADDEAFAMTVRRSREYFDDHTELASPVDGADVLELIGPTFHTFHSRLVECDISCGTALQNGVPQNAAIFWGEVFEHLFPPMRERVEVVDNVRNLPAVARSVRPTIRAEVYSRDPRNFLHSYTDDFSVTKNCDIDFSILNEGEIPADATVTWVVRNQGPEAGRVNDYGHTARRGRQLTQTEQTRYAGNQYMDCIVTQGGQFLSMSSIKVTITEKEYQRPKARPWYNRFR